MQLFDVYSLFDVTPVRAQGCRVWDDKGVEYLDLYGGHAVISIGHSHPHYIAALTEQLGRIGFYSNSVVNPLQQALADRIGRISGCDDSALFFVNSGAEANENALKLASFHTGKDRIVAFRRSFHGRTSGAVAVTDNPKIVAPFNAVHKVTFADLEDLDAVEKALMKGDVAAVIIEGIQGCGGIHVPSDAFLQGLRSLTEKYGALLILDEVQSGCGRTGRYFAHQWAGLRPDIVTMAKGIANGFPAGAVLIAPQIKPSKGMLGTTFGGNYLAMVAALAVLDVIEGEGLMANAVAVGDYLAGALAGLPGIAEVRGRGLMLGLEFDRPVAELRKRLLFEKHIFTGVAGQNMIRLLAPLVLSRDEAAVFVQSLKELL